MDFIEHHAVCHHAREYREDAATIVVRYIKEYGHPVNKKAALKGPNEKRISL